METLLEVRHVSVSIARPPAEVYRFAGDVENLPKWASGLARAVRFERGELIADSPMGQIRIRFAPSNALGVLDHDVVLESGEVVHNPMRVVPNGAGSELTFTLFRRPGMSEEDFAADASTVERDLRVLKQLVEAE